MFKQMYEEKYMRFPQGKSKALSFSYDDGVAADKRLLEIFKRYGLKGTFNLNSKLFGCPEWHSRLDEEQTYSLFADCGQEIALHGARHIYLTRVPLAEGVNEIVQNRVWLEDKFGRIVDGMAYAYNSFNQSVKDVLKACGIKYARTTRSTHGFGLPQDWLELNPTCHHADPLFDSLCENFFASEPERELKNRESLLFLVWGHSYEFDDNGNWHIMENFAKQVSARKDIWFATSGEIYDYVKAYENLVFSMDGERVFNPYFSPVWIEIRGKVYKIEGGEQIGFEK